MAGASTATDEEPKIKWVVPEEGSDVWADAMADDGGVPRTRRPPTRSSTSSFEPRSGGQGGRVTSCTRCRTAAGWPLVEPGDYRGSVPNLAMTPEELLAQEPEKDLSLRAEGHDPVVEEGRDADPRRP